VDFDLEPERRMWVLRCWSDHVLSCIEDRRDGAATRAVGLAGLAPAERLFGLAD
jgi:hypothetical protein